MEKNPFQQDEVNLSLFAVKIFKIFKDNLKTLIIFLVLGIVCGAGFFIVKQPTYESEMVINTGIINLPSGNSLIKTIQELIEDDNYSLLAHNLSLDQDKVRQIKKVEATNIYEKIQDEDEIRLLKVKVRVLDVTFLDDLQNGIINYLENIPYVKKRIDLQKANIINDMEFIKTELAQINQLQENIIDEFNKETGKANLIVMDPSESYLTSVNLNQQLLTLRKNLALVDNFQVIQALTQFRKPASPRLFTNIFFGMIGGLIIGLIIIFFKVLNQSLYLTEKTN